MWIETSIKVIEIKTTVLCTIEIVTKYYVSKRSILI